MNRDGKVYEKVCDNSKSNNIISPAVWGKPSKKDFATVV